MTQHWTVALGSRSWTSAADNGVTRQTAHRSMPGITSCEFDWVPWWRRS